MLLIEFVSFFLFWLRMKTWLYYIWVFCKRLVIYFAPVDTNITFFYGSWNHSEVTASFIITFAVILNITWLFYWQSSNSLRHFGLNVFQQLLRDSISNRASCVRAGMLNFLLDWFSQESNESVICKIAQLIQVIGGHSISGKDIRKIFALLRSERVGNRQPYYSLLLTSVLSMLNEKGPTSFFDLSGNDSVSPCMVLQSNFLISYFWTFCWSFFISSFSMFNYVLILLEVVKKWNTSPLYEVLELISHHFWFLERHKIKDIAYHTGCDHKSHHESDRRESDHWESWPLRDKNLRLSTMLGFRCERQNTSLDLRRGIWGLCHDS